MKLRSIILGLCTLSISSMCAQGSRSSDTQGRQKGYLSEPKAPNGSWNDPRRAAPMGYGNSLEGEMLVTTPGKQTYNFTIVNGALQMPPKMVGKFKQELKKSKPGDVFTFDLSTGTRVEMVRTADGWTPINGNTNPDDYSLDGPLIPGVIFIIALTLMILAMP